MTQQRTARLNAAVQAVRAYLEFDPPHASSLADPRPGHERERLADRAEDAVDAALKAGHTHTEIARCLGVAGLTVIGWIRDPQQHADALKRERYAAERYQAEVMFAIRRDVVRQVSAGGRGVKAAMAELYKPLSRVTIDEWMRQEADGTAPETPWEAMRVRSLEEPVT